MLQIKWTLGWLKDVRRKCGHPMRREMKNREGFKFKIKGQKKRISKEIKFDEPL